MNKRCISKLTKNKKYIMTLLFLLLSISSFSQIIMNRDPRISKATTLISSVNLQTTIENLVGFHTRHNMSTQSSQSKGIGSAATYLENHLSNISYGKEDVFKIERVNYKAGGEGGRINREITLPNIIATIKGTENPESIIVMLAHFDSRTADNNDSTSFAPGANDNGSGVAALIQIATVLAENPLPVTVKLMFLSGEEHGLHGASHMASVAKKDKWNIIAVLNNDMISNSLSSNTNIRNNSLLRVFSENIPYTENQEMERERIYNSSQNDSHSRQLARYVKEIGERYTDNLEIKLIYRNDRFGRGGDHTPFSLSGFTAVRICEYYENYDRTHKVTETIDGNEFGDVIKGVDFEYLRKNTIVNLAVVMNLALAPSAPLNVFTDVSELSNYTAIHWEHPEGADTPYGYYLLIRETDSSVWQKKIFVKGTHIKVPFSKDNFFFAVQSVNKEGNESIAVFSKGKK